ncbi:HNH endonuclease, partial [Klebsiella pneumoniae]
MKMTRLEAIKAWGRASREGKPIPEEVREVLISTQQNDSSHDFHVEPTTAKPLTAPAPIRSVGGYLTPKEMETYNQKRKLNNQKRKNKPLLYSDIMLELLASGLSKKQATKKAKDIIQRETLERLNNKK